MAGENGWLLVHPFWGDSYIQVINGMFLCGVCGNGYPLDKLATFAFMGLDKGLYRMSQPRCPRCAYVHNVGEIEPERSAGDAN
jgi:hypothetical protein